MCLRWLTSKKPKLGLTQELPFSIISDSTTGYTFTPCVGSFTFPGIDTRQKGPPAVGVSSERHRQMWGERNCLSFETAVGGIEPPVPRDHRSPCVCVCVCVCARVRACVRARVRIFMFVSVSVCAYEPATCKSIACKMFVSTLLSLLTG